MTALAKLADLVYFEVVGPRGRTVMLPHVYAALPPAAVEHTTVRLLSRADLIRRLRAAIEQALLEERAAARRQRG